jgi:hypothetical protein
VVSGSAIAVEIDVAAKAAGRPRISACAKRIVTAGQVVRDDTDVLEARRQAEAHRRR